MQNTCARYLLWGGLVVDGTAASPRPGSILITDGKIEAIGAVSRVGVEELDCTGKVIAPGFVDAHSHMDFFSASDDPHHFDSFAAQGVTTQARGVREGGRARQVARLVKGHDKLLSVHAKAYTSFSGTYWDEIRDRPGQAGNGAPAGIEHVFVNGSPSFSFGKVCAKRGVGRVLLS